MHMINVALAICLAPAFAAPLDKNQELINALQGVWIAESVEYNNSQLIDPSDSSHPFNKRTYTVSGTKFTVRLSESHSFDFSISLDGTKTPKAIDLRNESGWLMKGIFLLDGDRLVVSIAENPNDTRPKRFNSTEGKSVTVYILRRDKR